MRIFKTKWLDRFARKEHIADSGLRDAIGRVERGLVDADLGGGLLKQRVARLGSGRSGGYRMIVAYRAGDRAVFLYGFGKNERENIQLDELKDLRDLGARLLNLSSRAIDDEVRKGYLQEISDHGNPEEA